MQQFLKWTLETIREEDSCFSWMEEHRYTWAPVAKMALSNILEGKSILIITDEKRAWFQKYILHEMNDFAHKRPLLPFYSLLGCVPQLKGITTTSELELVEDMLDISYPQGYMIWYIGKGDHPYTKLAYRREESFLWIMDEEVQDSFAFRSADPLLDIKLLQLYKLFNRSLSSVLFGELELE